MIRWVELVVFALLFTVVSVMGCRQGRRVGALGHDADEGSERLRPVAAPPSDDPVGGRGALSPPPVACHQ